MYRSCRPPPYARHGAQAPVKVTSSHRAARAAAHIHIRLRPFARPLRQQQHFWRARAWARSHAASLLSRVSVRGGAASNVCWLRRATQLTCAVCLNTIVPCACILRCVALYVGVDPGSTEYRGFWVHISCRLMDCCLSFRSPPPPSPRRSAIAVCVPRFPFRKTFGTRKTSGDPVKML